VIFAEVDVPEILTGCERHYLSAAIRGEGLRPARGGGAADDISPGGKIGEGELAVAIGDQFRVAGVKFPIIVRINVHAPVRRNRLTGIPDAIVIRVIEEGS